MWQAVQSVAVAVVLIRRKLSSVLPTQCFNHQLLLGRDVHVDMGLACVVASVHQVTSQPFVTVH